MDLDTLVPKEGRTRKQMKADGDKISRDCLLKEGTVTTEDIKCIINDISSNPKEVRELLANLGIEDDQLEDGVGVDENDGAAINSRIFQKLTDPKRKELTYAGLSAALDNSSLKRADLVVKHCLINPDFIPKSILARGKRALEAYRRALKKGKTCDKRVKVLLIGQDRAGKTSVARALRGEALREDEPTTVGVKIDEPLQNASEEPWRYSSRKSSAFEEKCVEIMRQDLSEESRDSTGNVAVQPDRLSVEIKKTDSQHVGENCKTCSPLAATGRDEIEAIPNDIKRLLEESLELDDLVPSDGIWPVIGELSGQTLDRALHPVFMTSEALYLLMFDLSRNAGKKNDSTVHHILRSLDTVHFLRQSKEEETYPPVILVGTHADCIKPDDPDKIMEPLLKRFQQNSLMREHVIGNVVVDNTLSGLGPGKEDPEIIRLRKMVLEMARMMPHTKKEIPLQWLYIESLIETKAREGKKFVLRRTFKEEIVEKDSTYEKEEDIEQLLRFLHDRGTVVYHAHTETPDGLVVLDPQWLVNVFRQILNVVPSKEDSMRIRHCREELLKRGNLAAELLDYSCKTLHVYEIKQSLIFIMKKFNLLCQNNSNEDQVYLVPCMLVPKPENEVMLPKSSDENSLPALYLTFKTDYVPAGLFPKLISLFASWTASKTSCEQQNLFSNAACFILDDTTFLQIVCHESVIKLRVSSQGNSYAYLGYHAEVYSVLETCQARIRDECHWLHAVSWEVSVQCTLCAGKEGAKEGPCTWHDTEGCLHDDCAHYLPLNSRLFFCPFANKVIPAEKFKDWLNVTKNNNLRQNPVPMADQQTLKFCNQDRSKVQVTLLAGEWGSSKGGLPTVNRLLAIELAKHPKLEVSLYVSEYSEDDVRRANSHGITIIKAQKLVGYEPLESLGCLPQQGFRIDVVIGHGTKLGKQVQLIKQFYPTCAWIQFEHTAPEELAMYKNYYRNISIGEDKHETEVQLSAMADLVVAVGPKLSEYFRRYLRPYEEKGVFQIVPSPSIFQEFGKYTQAKQDGKTFHVLVFGRGDVEDFNLKGYDIASKAISELKDTSYHLLFVGAAVGEREKVAQNLLKYGIPRSQLTVRGFIKSRKKLAMLFCEVDLAIMPSRTEGFGLTALEALSAGLPILVGGNSGFAEALKQIDNPLAVSCIVDSEDGQDWAAAIQAVREKPRAQRLQDVQSLSTCFEKFFSWSRQCNNLVKEMLFVVEGKKDLHERRLTAATERIQGKSKQDRREQTESIATASGLLQSKYETGEGNADTKVIASDHVQVETDKEGFDGFPNQLLSTDSNSGCHRHQKATENVFKDSPDLQDNHDQQIVEDELHRTQPGLQLTEWTAKKAHSVSSVRTRPGKGVLPSHFVRTERCEAKGELKDYKGKLKSTLSVLVLFAATALLFSFVVLESCKW